MDQDQQLTVHLVPHSHQDMGWVKTIDEYYSGANKGEQVASVKLILDSVIDELSKDPTRKFTQATTGFLKTWWEAQNNNTKETVKKLVKNKQIEFVNGGWVDNDEGCPNFDDIINNMMIGHEFIKETFGVAPRIAWNLDVFGHTDAGARLFSQMGMEALFFSRLDQSEKNERIGKRSMNFLWRPSSGNFGN